MPCASATVNAVPSERATARPPRPSFVMNDMCHTPFASWRYPFIAERPAVLKRSALGRSADRTSERERENTPAPLCGAGVPPHRTERVRSYGWLGVAGAVG